MINQAPRAPWLKNERVDWDVYDAFKKLTTVLPICGEGSFIIEQIATAVNKLVYKWYNDGDVFDNNFGMEGWLNDLSSYANWLSQYVFGMQPILQQIQFCHTEGEYEQLLLHLWKHAESILDDYKAQPKVGSVYECAGAFRYTEPQNSDDNFSDDDE